MEEDKSGHLDVPRHNLPASLIPSAVPVSTTEVSSDAMLVELWLHGRPAHTRRAYRFEWERFRAHVGECSLRAVRLRDVQGYLDHLAALAPNTQRRALGALKSIFSFAVRVGYLPANLGAFLRRVAAKDTLSERILDEATVHRVIAVEPNPRNRVMLRLLYAAGLRVSELCALRWRDVVERGDAGQLTVYGKGGKTRVVLLSVSTWRELMAIRPDGAAAAAPVFPSQKGGGHLDPSQVLRIMKKAAARAGLDAPISPHWFRHAHASHALERGCPISLVQATLGHASVSTTGRYLHARPGDSSARYLGV
jgi:integrase/recombinase XerD